MATYEEGFDWDSYHKLTDMLGNPIFDFVTCTDEFKAQLATLERLKERFLITKRMVTETNEVTDDQLKELVASVESVAVMFNKHIKASIKPDGTISRSLKLYIGGQTVNVVVTGTEYA